MSDKIFVDASKQAVIKFSDGSPNIVTPTLQEAVIAFRNLPREKQEIATIHTEGGFRYGPTEIEHLHHK